MAKEVAPLIRFSDGNVQLAYDNMKVAQEALDETYKRVEPRLKAIQAKRDQLRKQSEFCLMMAMFCFAGPMLIIIAIGVYKMIVGTTLPL